MAIDERVDALEATTALLRTHNRSALAAIALGAVPRSEVMRGQPDGWATSIYRPGYPYDWRVAAVSVKAHEAHRVFDHDRRSTIDVAPANDVGGLAPVDPLVNTGDHHWRRRHHRRPDFAAVVDDHQALFDQDPGKWLRPNDAGAVRVHFIRPETL